MGKSTYKGPRGSITIPLLHLAKWQEDDLHTRMNCERHIYNAMLGKLIKRMHYMEQTLEYRNVATEINRLSNEIYTLRHPKKETENNTDDTKQPVKEEPVLTDKEKRSIEKQVSEKEKELKVYYKQKNEILKKYHFTQYDFISEVAKYNCFPENVSSNMAQVSIADPLWVAFESRYYPKRRNKEGEVPMPKFKTRKFRDTMSLQSNGISGIRLIEGVNGKKKGYWLILSNQYYTKKKNKIFISNKQLNDYEMEALNRPVAKLIVQEVRLKGKKAYTLTVSYKGMPPIKYDALGNKKHPYDKTGLVGITIYNDMVCAVSKDEIYTMSLLPENYEQTEKEKEEANRRMSHLRFVNNRQNYYKDGRIKKSRRRINGEKMRLKWFRSHNYLDQVRKNSEYFRIERIQKELKQWEICNHILGMGNTFYFLDMNLNTQKEVFDEDKGKTKSDFDYHKEKEKRKMISATAPAALIAKINGRLKNMEQPEVEKIKVPAKFYWYRHDLETWDNPSTSEFTVENYQIPQNIYRAYLLLHLKPIEEEEEEKEESCFYDTDKCKEDFIPFMNLYLQTEISKTG